MAYLAGTSEQVLVLSEYIGHGTNNLAEYRAIVRGLEEADKAGVTEVGLFCDSQVVVRQLTGEYATRCPHLLVERDRVAELIGRFDSVIIQHVYDDDNEAADQMARRAVRRRR